MDIKAKLENLKADLMKSYKSWTIRLNTLAGAIIVALPIAQEVLPQLAPLMSPATYQVLSGIIITMNIILRFKTSTSLRDK